MAKDKQESGATSLDEVAALVPSPRSVIVLSPFDPENWDAERAKVRVRVRPMSAEQIFESVGRLLPFVEGLESGKTLDAIAADVREELLAIAEIATDKSADFLRKLDGADFLDVFEKIYTENERFFDRARALLQGPVVARMRAMFRSVGPTQSSTSPATESPTP